MSETLSRVLGLASFVSTAFSVVGIVLLCAFVGPDLAMVLRMYGGDLEPVRATLAFPWLVCVLSLLPAVALGLRKQNTLATLACVLPLVVCGVHLRALYAAAASTP